MTKDELTNGIHQLIKWFNQAVINNSLSGLDDPTVSNYASYQDYVMDLRTRVSRASWEMARLAYEASKKYKRLELMTKIKQAEKQLEYQRDALAEGFSKSQSETVARKRVEVDEEYIKLQEEKIEAEVDHHDYINLKWTITNNLNAMAQYKKSSFEN